MIPVDMTDGFEHKQRDGTLRVVSYASNKSVCVEFIKTGYITSCQASQVRLGTVKDRFVKSVFGIGFIGGTKFKACSGRSGEHSKCYTDWRNMIARCYSESNLKRNPSYAGVTVCDEWHNFQNFAEWYEENRPNDGGEYHLDKDILSHGNKVYSPSTCLFVKPIDNYEEASAKCAKFNSPSGDVVEVFNVSKFSRDNKLSQSAMNAITLGKRKSHKGWTKA